MRDPRWILGAAALAGCGVGLAACSQAAPEPIVDPEMRVALVALASQPTELWSAHEIVRRDCMREAGFDLPFSSVARVESESALIGLGGLFLTTDSARASGYGTTVRDTASETDLIEDKLAEANPTRYEKVLFGDPQESEQLALSNGAVASRGKSGCVAEADIAVFGSVRNALHVQEFTNEINAQAGEIAGGLEGALKQNLDDYRQCMATSGITVRGLDADKVAEQRFGVYRDPGDPPSADEQEMAATDYRCQQEARLIDVVNEEFLSKSGDWATANEAAIMANYEVLTASVARAKEILAAS